MPIANRYQNWLQKKIGGFSVPEQKAINNALNELEHDPMASSYHCARHADIYGDVNRTIELGVGGISIDYKFDIAGLVTIIDVYRSPWYAIKVLITDFSP